MYVGPGTYTSKEYLTPFGKDDKLPNERSCPHVIKHQCGIGADLEKLEMKTFLSKAGSNYQPVKKLMINTETGEPFADLKTELVSSEDLKKMKDLIFRKVYNELISNESRKMAIKHSLHLQAQQQIDYYPEPILSPTTKSVMKSTDKEDPSDLSKGNLSTLNSKKGGKRKRKGVHYDDEPEAGAEAYEYQMISPQKGTPNVHYPGRDSKDKRGGSKSMTARSS